MARSRRRQSPVDQIERLLANGCCPVHGLFMPQVAGWYQLLGEDQWFTIVECPRRDCEQRAKAYSVDGPWEAWERPLPTRMFAQAASQGDRPLLWVLTEIQAQFRALADAQPARRPLPPFIRDAFEEIADRATEL